ncbi:SMP-30/gluconolactonase/LRE family protein [Frankia sp. R82]|uniref:SMP-30/gluconolactonase/LRE family protein n=1 Tax=Frankia sp. R82 TaxID=2950553 RepID=UPI002042D896|nr:SMP-30/gluconolactonase/LRE family protein [Frankia sp. R82]MCM3885590.1 SMP-30/gluconolactonase/LRE family protein [Frankia sp. R82]
MTTHGEGPLWVPAWGGLHLVDLLAGDVLALDARTGAVERHHLGTIAATVRPRTNGGAVVALERGFALLDPPLPHVPRPDTPPPDDGLAAGPAPGATSAAGMIAGSPFRSGAVGSVSWRVLPSLWPAARGLRMNDGGCDPDGRFYCGSMAYDETPGAGSLHRLDPDATTTVVLGGVTISNGLAWSPDGTRAYYVDTPTSRIDVFDYDPAGGLTGRRPFAVVPQGPGQPDGLAVDADGGVWTALWGGGAVCRFTGSGSLDQVIELPVPRTTACAFGGPDLGTLYVTTSRLATDTDRHPGAGAIFAIDAGVRGLPALPFAG